MGVFDGWWFDGAYDYNAMYNHPAANREDAGTGYETFASAARGNGNYPWLAVAFNDGFGPNDLHGKTQYMDYLAGESYDDRINQTWQLPENIGNTTYIDAVTGNSFTPQWHLLTFIGHGFNGGGAFNNDTPRFTNDDVQNWMYHNIYRNNGAVTWDVPMHLGDNDHDSAPWLVGRMALDNSRIYDAMMAILRGASGQQP